MPLILSATWWYLWSRWTLLVNSNDLMMHCIALIFSRSAPIPCRLGPDFAGTPSLDVSWIDMNIWIQLAKFSPKTSRPSDHLQIDSELWRNTWLVPSQLEPEWWKSVEISGNQRFVDENLQALNKLVAKSSDFASFSEKLSTATQDLAYQQVPTLPGNCPVEL